MTRVVSTVSKAEMPSVKGDFNAVSDRLDYVVMDSDDPYHYSRIDNWNAYISISPQDARDILLRGLPDDINVEISLDEDGDGRLEYSGGDIIDCACEFDLNKKIRREGDASIRADAQNAGLGRMLVRNQIEFLKGCGIEKFEVHASASVGGYAWARFGYLPIDKDMNEIRENVQRYFNALKPILTDEEISQIEGLTELSSKSDLIKIADQQTDLYSRIRAVFDMAADASLDENIRSEAAYKQTLMGRGLNTYGYNHIGDCLFNKEPIRLGRMLLLGTNWHGSIDLDNETQMRHVDNYTGGFKHISFR